MFQVWGRRSGMSTMAIFKAEAQGDRVYVEAATLEEAKAIFKDQIGDVPEALVTWKKMPEKWQPSDPLFSWGDDILRA
jgi:hypothetical protein